MNQFINAASATIGSVADTMETRGSQYADTWGADAKWHLLNAVSEKVLGVRLTDDQCRLIALAAFIDQKYCRFAGGYRDDTAIDMVSYISALAEFTKRYDETNIR